MAVGINDYLKESDPDIMCINETKLVEDIELIVYSKSKYNI